MLTDPSAPTAAPVSSPRAAAPPLSRVRPGSIDDAKRVRATLQALLRTRERQSEYLEALIEAAQTKCIHFLLTGPDGTFFRDWESFVVCRLPYGLGVPVGALDAVIRERSDPKAQAQRLAERARPLHRYGENRRPGDAATTTTVAATGGGNARRYLLGVLARDHPGVLEALRQGRFPSVHAAALAAGIVPARITVALEPAATARMILRRFSPEDVARIIALLRDRSWLPGPLGNAQHRPPAGAAA